MKHYSVNRKRISKKTAPYIRRKMRVKWRERLKLEANYGRKSSNRRKISIRFFLICSNKGNLYTYEERLSPCFLKTVGKYHFIKE